jgi:hypothetical protein
MVSSARGDPCKIPFGIELVARMMMLAGILLMLKARIRKELSSDATVCITFRMPPGNMANLFLGGFREPTRAGQLLSVNHGPSAMGNLSIAVAA